jgi:hypothetical protein
MALWHAIQVIQIGIFDQPDQTYWLFLSHIKFRVSVEGEISTPKVPQCSVLSPTLFNMYINDGPQTNGVYLARFAEDTCLYATDRKEGFVVRNL